MKKLSPEQRQAALAEIDDIKADPEYESRTELHKRVDKLEAGIRSQDAEEQAGREARIAGRAARITAGELKPKSRLRMAAEAVGENLSDVGGTVRNIGKQFAGTLAGAAENVPGYVPAVEAVGELGQKVIPGFGHVWPTPGTHERVIQDAPSPTTARVSGAALTAPLAAEGNAGKVLFGPGNALYRTGEAAANLIPGAGALAPRLAGAALGQGALATTEAVTRRLPQALATGTAPPIAWGEEVVAPAALGTAMAAPGAMQSAAVNGPNGGRTAKRYAEDRYSGLHERENFPKKSLGDVEEQGRADVKQAKTEANRAIDQKMGEAKELSANDLDAFKAQQAQDVEQAKEQGTRYVNEAASREEGSFRRRFQEKRKAAKSNLDSALSQIAEDPRVHDPETGKPLLFDNTPVQQKMREIVSGYAREDTAMPGGFPANPDEPVKLFDAKGDLIKGNSPEQQKESHLALGREFASVENELNSFLGDKASIADYRTAVQNFQKRAESGTPLQKYVYQDVLRTLRDHVASVDPTGTLGQANKEYRGAMGELERTREIAYGKGGNKLGEGTADDRFGYPSEEPAEISPTEERRAAEWLSQVGEATPKRTEHENELRQYGYGPELDEIAARKAEARSSLEDVSARQKQGLRERQRLATEGLRQARDLVENGRTDEMGIQQSEGALDPVRDAEQQASVLKESKRAYDESQFPGLGKLALWAGPAALGFSHGGMYGNAFGLVTLGHAAYNLRQPIRSRLAAGLPEGEAYRASMAPLLALPELGVGHGAALMEAARHEAEEAEKKRSQLVDRGRQVLDTIINPPGTKPKNPRSQQVLDTMIK